MLNQGKAAAGRQSLGPLYSHSPALSIAVVKLFDPKILRNFKHLAPPKKVKCINRTFGEKKGMKIHRNDNQKGFKKALSIAN